MFEEIIENVVLCHRNFRAFQACVQLQISFRLGPVWACFLDFGPGSGLT